MTEIQGAEPASTTTSFFAQHKALVAVGAAVVVLGAGTTIALTSSGSSTKHAGTNSLPGAVAGVPTASSSDDDFDVYANFQPNPNAGPAFTPEGSNPVSSQGYPVLELGSATFDVAQTLNIGAQGTGAGAGKIAFNPLAITMPIDKNTPTLFKMTATGTTFQTITLFEQKHANSGTTLALAPAQNNKNPATVIAYVFKLAAIKTMALHGGTVDLTLDYGGLQMYYRTVSPSGDISSPFMSGWNRITNVTDTSTSPIGN